jgi:hypothetical protein
MLRHRVKFVCSPCESEITASLGRSASQIAQDIKRRMMPGYLSAIGSVRTALDREIARRARQTLVLRECAKVLGVSPLPQHPLDRNRFAADLKAASYARVDVEVAYDAKIELTFHVRTPEMTRALLESARDLKAEDIPQVN